MKIGRTASFYTIGDGGNDQLANWCIRDPPSALPTRRSRPRTGLPIRQVAAAEPRRLDPDDNPELNGVRSHIFTYGHRNMQGIVFGPGRHALCQRTGAKTDDEVNILQSGGNYGWAAYRRVQDNMAIICPLGRCHTPCRQSEVQRSGD